LDTISETSQRNKGKLFPHVQLWEHGLRAYVWSAVDVDSGEILAVYASWSRDMLITMKFIRNVLDRCINKPLIIVDRSP
jgi:transposase-like protein